MCTVGWGETYSCQYKGYQQFTQFLSHDDDTFVRRFESEGTLFKFEYQIAYEDDKQLRLLRSPDLKGEQIYLNKTTGEWLNLYVSEPSEQREEWLVNEQGGLCARVPE